ncbi:MAG TPA: hypothetical protein VHH52_07330, partial [Pseudonocardiaceae bacterium]|nr:hypothetical protein [Pseudonocardiaceae bacterium]
IAPVLLHIPLLPGIVESVVPVEPPLPSRAAPPVTPTPRSVPMPPSVTTPAARPALTVPVLTSLLNQVPQLSAGVTAVLGTVLDRVIADLAGRLPTPRPFDPFSAFPYSLKTLIPSGTGASGSVQPGGPPDPSLALPVILLALLLARWRAVQLESLRIPTGIVLSSPTPPG